MAQYLISASALIKSPAERIYNIIADYRNGHPRIVPKPYFVSMEVERGGVGSGTVVNFQMRLMGKLQSYRATISEPEPGHILEEANDGGGGVTRFTVDPENGGLEANVTITTAIAVREGFAGKIEGWMASQLLRPIYVKELRQLAAVAADWKEDGNQ